MRKAVILLSGGIDSATTAAYAANQDFQLYAMTFSYGQKHSIEIEFARKLCDFFKIKDQLIIEIPSKLFSSSALSVDSISGVPKNRDIDSDKSIPLTYVPARNIIFLSYSISYAETINARDIFIGVNAIDYSGYPDCRPEFLASFESMANIGTKAGIMGDRFKIHAPLLKLKKSEIIQLGASLGLDYSLTHSCYDPDTYGYSCGRCDSCQIRKKGFLEAGIDDPTKYRLK